MKTAILLILLDNLKILVIIGFPMSNLKIHNRSTSSSTPPSEQPKSQESFSLLPDLGNLFGQLKRVLGGEKSPVKHAKPRYCPELVDAPKGSCAPTKKAKIDFPLVDNPPQQVAYEPPLLADELSSVLILSS